jgi:hypothetical protein
MDGVRMRTLSAALLALLLLVLAPSAADAALRQFQSPTKNIGCAISRSFARCDIKARTWSPPPRPAACDLDYGQGLIVERRGRGHFVCAGDTVLGKGRVLRYGRSIRMGAMTCTSRRRGMRCQSRRGHGFLLSRDRYRRF